MKTIHNQFFILLVSLLSSAVLLTEAVPAFAQRGGKDNNSGAFRGAAPSGGSSSKESSYTPWSRTSPSSSRPTITRPSGNFGSSERTERTSPLVVQRQPQQPSTQKPSLPPTQIPAPPVFQKPQQPSTPSTGRPFETRPAARPAETKPAQTRPIEIRPADKPSRPFESSDNRFGGRRPDGRPDNHPDRPNLDGRPGNHPDRPRPDGKPDNHPDRPRPDGRPGNHPDRPNLDGRPGNHPDKPRPDGRPDNRPDRRPDNNHGHNQGHYRPPHPIGPPPSVINHYRRHFTGYNSYWTPDWYHRHPGTWNPIWIPYRNWWLCPSWNTTWSWFGPGFFTGIAVGNVINPYYYNYGSNIIYSGGMVYVNGVPYVSASEYYRQALTLANTNINAYIAQPQPIVIEKEVPVVVEKIVEKEVPVIVEKEVAAKPVVPSDTVADKKSTGNDSEWLPMGTFAFVDDAGDSKGEPDKSRIIQLASDKKGTIRGNYIDEAKNETRQLIGAVDSKTQRVALKFTDDDKTVMECGLWNLTQDSVPLLVHKSETDTENSTLIRLTPPEEGEENSNTSATETEEDLAP